MQIMLDSLTIATLVHQTKQLLVLKISCSCKCMLGLFTLLCHMQPEVIDIICAAPALMMAMKMTIKVL